ncbi:hypothetical protein GE21DRAFT_1290781 [Neurospora crassa]|nr:hypothetical protein GE21DRAFT_1290781 [Neurospora crassa]
MQCSLPPHHPKGGGSWELTKIYDSLVLASDGSESAHFQTVNNTNSSDPLGMEPFCLHITHSSHRQTVGQPQAMTTRTEDGHLHTSIPIRHRHDGSGWPGLPGALIPNRRTVEMVVQGAGRTSLPHLGLGHGIGSPETEGCQWAQYRNGCVHLSSVGGAP